jgi:hypothetical protein
MGSRAVEKGPTDRRVRENLVRLRGERQLTTQGLAARLTDLGRPIRADGITKIEAGQRRVDVDDLVALAIALEVNPSALLLPPRVDDEPVPLVGEVAPPAWGAWQWADGRYPLPTRSGDDEDEPYNTPAEVEDFQHYARPTELGVAARHPLVQAAAMVTDRAQRAVIADGSRTGRDVRRAALNRAVQRLLAELEELDAEGVDRRG